jgi:hypothetical protein
LLGAETLGVAVMAATWTVFPNERSSLHVDIRRTAIADRASLSVI